MARIEEDCWKEEETNAIAAAAESTISKSFQDKADTFKAEIESAL